MQRKIVWSSCIQLRFFLFFCVFVVDSISQNDDSVVFVSLILLVASCCFLNKFYLEVQTCIWEQSFLVNNRPFSILRVSPRFKHLPDFNDGDVTYQFDSTGMFHWCKERTSAYALLVSNIIMVFIVSISSGFLQTVACQFEPQN